jgi:excinuclease UvrABC helicase subunit UvrB
MSEQTTKRKIVVSKAIIRPTGLLDPQIIIKPTANQVDDVIEQVRLRVLKGQRVLITTMTKKFSEELDLYFKQLNIKSAYIHSDVETLERLDILSDLRRGKYDVLIGINLLREGLDLPEVSLVAIFDADKEGFLRSRTSLIQIIGRAARHMEGTVIMYADKITNSMKLAIDETNEKRQLQEEYNKKHGIVPKSTKRDLATIADDVRDEVAKDSNYGIAGANLTISGFEDTSKNKKKNKKSNDEEDQMEITSGFARKGKPVRKAKAMQVYTNFDTLKQQIKNEIETLKLPKDELQERLQIAIDAYNFEEAAAIRDILGED